MNRQFWKARYVHIVGSFVLNYEHLHGLHVQTLIVVSTEPLELTPPPTGLLHGIMYSLNTLVIT